MYISDEIRFGRFNEEKQAEGTFFIEKNFVITGITYYRGDEEVEETYISFK